MHDVLLVRQLVLVCIVIKVIASIHTIIVSLCGHLETCGIRLVF